MPGAIVPRASRTRWGTLLVVATVAGWLLALLPVMAAPVAAHAYLERAEPPVDSVLSTAPGRLQIWFTETIEPSFSEIVVIDITRRPVHTTRARASDDRLSLSLDLPPLPEGAYTVTWKALSAVDGHATRGFYALTIGTATAPMPAPVEPDAPAVEPPPIRVQAMIRWLLFAGQTLLVGSLIFSALILAPALAAAGQRAGSTAGTAARRRQSRLQISALGALGLAALAALVMQAAIATGLPPGEVLGPPVWSVLTETHFGLVWAGRVVVLLALGGLVLGTRRWPTAPAWATGLGLALGLLLLLTTSLTSHAAATRDNTIVAVVADWLHLVATTAWLGGLAGLALVAPAAHAACPPASRPRLRERLVSRFSVLSLSAVGVLLTTGVYGALLHIDSLLSLPDSAYGQALLGKIVLLLPMLALGALNLLWVRPTLARVARQAAARAGAALASATRAWTVLTRAVRVELVLGALVLLVTGELTSLAPARQPMANVGFTATETVADLRVTLRVTPGVPGDNTLEMVVTRQGQPVDDVVRALARLTFLDQELGETEVVLTPTGNGRYVARGRQLSVSGRWQAEVIVRREGQDDARTAMRFGIPVSAGPATTGDLSTSVPALSPLGIGALVLLALAGALVALAVRLRRGPAISGALFGAGAGAVAVATYILMTTGMMATASQTTGPRNPYPPTAQSLAVGRTLYTANCQTCHGVSGRGDGPQAAAMAIQPLDLTQHVAFHTDSELYRFVSQGVRGTPMPPFAGLLTEEQIWHVVNYIRTFDAYGPGNQPTGTRSP